MYLDEGTGAKSSAARKSAEGLPLALMFGGTLFVSALLLSSVQPLFARMVLPLLGGTPAVWSVAMVFFQATLLAGYAYAHALVRRAGLRKALAIHALVMAGALLFLPVGIAAGFDAPPESGQPLWLLTLFAASIGLPFFAVSANAPLLQAWFARTGHPDRDDPYFLYGASNLGSFLALLAYPVAIEPLLPLGAQSAAWSRLYLLLGAGVIGCGLFALAHARAATPVMQDEPRVAHPTWADRLRWMALASLPSALLVAVTAHLSTNIAAVPLLWVLPLAAFLLTFVIAFQRTEIIPQRMLQLMLPTLVVAAMLTYGMPTELGGLPGLAINLFAFLVIALAWHTALVALRPPAAHLTDFYLSMSAGGVIGGAFTTLAAPVLFDSVIEFPLLLSLGLLIVPEARKLLQRRLALPATAALLVIAFYLDSFTGVEHRDRSFFGVVSTRLTEGESIRLLVHGTTVHGAERVADIKAGVRPAPITYYDADGPLAGAIAIEQARRAEPLAVGVVGLGVGSMACLGEPGESWRFFEIDPAVIRAATDPNRFTFLSSCSPEAPIMAGDARLSLKAEVDGGLDVLVIDAFSSDAIPIHLMTREALALYMAKLAPDGVLVMHISNQFMELASVVAANAAAENLAAAGRLHRPASGDGGWLELSSEVVALARDPALIDAYVAAGWNPLKPRADVSAWTDDFSNVIGAMLRRQGLL